MKNKYIIGLDFGNYYTQPCVIIGMDNMTRRGGTTLHLTDPQYSNIPGIPSAFYYKDGEIICGYGAARYSKAIRCMKQHLKKGESETIEDRTFTYEEMIKEFIQYAIRLANEILEKRFHTTTNLVALAHPVTLNPEEKQRLVNCVEAATLVSGEYLEVVGLIEESASAALDYEGSNLAPKRETIATYDLGAGTFDFSVTKVYPEGIKLSDDSVCYHEHIMQDGIKDIGGTRFDECVRQCIRENALKEGMTINTGMTRFIQTGAEAIKCGLSDAERVPTNIFDDEGNEIPEVTREAFEAKARPLIEKTIETVQKVLEIAGEEDKPDKIVLCGGASQMPLVKRMLHDAFPEYKISEEVGVGEEATLIFHNPGMAIGAGAARFQGRLDGIIKRTVYDIGIVFRVSEEDERIYVKKYIPAGTPIPYTSAIVESHQVEDFESQYTTFTVREAKKVDPNEYNVEDDYEIICQLQFDHGKVVKGKEAKHKSRLVIDKRGLLLVEVFDNNDVSRPPQRRECKIENIQ